MYIFEIAMLAGLTMCTGPCGWWDSGPVASARFNSIFMFKSYTFFNIIAYFFQPFQKIKASCEVAKSCFYYTIFVKFSDIFSLKKKHENACFYEWFHFTQCTKNGKCNEKCVYALLHQSLKLLFLWGKNSKTLILAF